MDFSKLGKADLIVAGLKIWVHRREFEHAQDFGMVTGCVSLFC